MTGICTYFNSLGRASGEYEQVCCLAWIKQMKFTIYFVKSNLIKCSLET